MSKEKPKIKVTNALLLSYVNHLKPKHLRNDEAISYFITAILTADELESYVLNPGRYFDDIVNKGHKDYHMYSKEDLIEAFKQYILQYTRPEAINIWDKVIKTLYAKYCAGFSSYYLTHFEYLMSEHSLGFTNLKLEDFSMKIHTKSLDSFLKIMEETISRYAVDEEWRKTLKWQSQVEK